MLFGSCVFTFKLKNILKSIIVIIDTSRTSTAKHRPAPKSTKMIGCWRPASNNSRICQFSMKINNATVNNIDRMQMHRDKP